MGNMLFNIGQIINTCIKDCTETNIEYYTEYDFDNNRFIYDPIEQRYISIYKKKLYTIDEISEQTDTSSPSKTGSSYSSFSSHSPHSEDSIYYDNMYFIQK